MPNVDKVIARIPDLEDVKLMNLYRNCLRGKDDPRRCREAESILDAVKAHWRRQVIAAQVSNWSPQRPERGMLGFFGYKVGHGGECTSVRRLMLDDVMSIDLPLVSSPAYMSEWGKPKSVKRFGKLRRTLCALLEASLERPGYEEACAQWDEDIEYLDATWDCRVS